MNSFFKALNDPTRRDILNLLKEKDMTAGEIADYFNISKPSISHHLDLLKTANLVSTQRDGKYILYSLETTSFEEAVGWILEIMEKNKSK